MQKMTIEEFLQLKERLSNLISEFDEYSSEHSKDSDYSEKEDQFVERYYHIQSPLFDYDLSDIPFEAWEGVTIFSDEQHIADFSKTKANLDFSIIDYYGNGNFRGCNVRNLESLKGALNHHEFDQQVVEDNPRLFISDNFSSDFQYKYYSCTLKIADIASLSSSQLEELLQKDYKSHFYFNEYNEILFNSLGLQKVIELYNKSIEEYNAIHDLLDEFTLFGLNVDKNELNKLLGESDINDIKNNIFSYIRDILIKSGNIIHPNNYPELFVKENSDLFLINVNIPEEVKKHYYDRSLTFKEIISYPDVFEKLPVELFVFYSSGYNLYISNDSSNYVKFFINNYGIGELSKLIVKHAKVFDYLEEHGILYRFSQFLSPNKSAEASFIEALKDTIYEYKLQSDFKVVDGADVNYVIPEWLSSVPFKVIEEISNEQDILNLDELTIIINPTQRKAVKVLNPDNIKMFQQKTRFFTHRGNEWVSDVDMFDMVCTFIRHIQDKSFTEDNIDFKNGTLSYDEFEKIIAQSLFKMRGEYYFLDYTDYDWMKGEFRDKYPEIFMDMDAPVELKKQFYRNKITPEFLYNNPDFIPYLINRNLSEIINADMYLIVAGMVDSKGNFLPDKRNFIDEYVSRYGNEKLLKLLAKYGKALNTISITNLHNEIDDEKLIEKAIRLTIYKRIITGKEDYRYLENVPEFVAEHPDLFINLDSITSISEEEKERLIKYFYSRGMAFDDIKNYPELVEILKDKDLYIAFGNSLGNSYSNRLVIDYYTSKHKEVNELELLKVLGNEAFLKLCSKYGRYLVGVTNHLYKEVCIVNGEYVDIEKADKLSVEPLTFAEIDAKIENIVARECRNGNLPYNPDDAPEFLKEKYPELFIDDSLPEDFKKYFYNYSNNYPMSFDVLKNYQNLLPQLKGKSIKTALLRNNNYKAAMEKYFDLFGEEKAIKLGIGKPETIKIILQTNKVDLLRAWYDKTGGKFIPDIVVMQNFSIEEADKFLASGSNWSNLMKINGFAKSMEARDAMLKLAYSFGAFDQDQRGFKKLQELLTDIPKRIDVDNAYIIYRIDDQLNFIKSSGILNTEIVNYNTNYIGLFDPKVVNNLFNALKSELPEIDINKDIFNQLYRLNVDGSRTLTINSQSCPKTTKYMREIMNLFVELPIITPDKAHQLFGGFELKYDPDFREFLLANLDSIVNNSDYITYLANIQKQFQKIKAANSNRVLTLDLAVSYVQENKYENVNPGNERVAEISAIAGYSQEDFNTLQKIYNYGKQRVFSSIPRIEKTVDNYTFEILRLDDPLAMAIGTLSDCCQELNNCAEVCMEHSMVDKNGRVFVIRDADGNIVAQSWVWRNKDVLCFDNIEIPAKAFNRAAKENPELGRKGFTDQVYKLYKLAAQELIAADEKIFKELLESGKITQEQYDGLRLGKITVGLGFNDIAESLKQNSVVDRSDISRPLPFQGPVQLSRGLYTSDSITQYVLDSREDRKPYEGETIPIHSDTYIEYNDANFKEKLLITLQKLEVITKNRSVNLSTFIGSGDYNNIVSEIAANYGLNPETARIVMNPNFAIIYDINGNRLRIADLLFNTRIDNDEQQMDIENIVAMQIWLALAQISEGKTIDISELSPNQKAMYEKVVNLTSEIDTERGVGSAR